MTDREKIVKIIRNMDSPSDTMTLGSLFDGAGILPNALYVMEGFNE